MHDKNIAKLKDLDSCAGEITEMSCMLVFVLIGGQPIDQWFLKWLSLLFPIEYIYIRNPSMQNYFMIIV